MPRWSDILAQAADSFGHIIRKISASGTDEQPNRPYLDFAGNCTVEDTGEAIKVTVPDVPAGQVSVGQTTTLAAGSPASVTERGTTTHRILDFGIPTGPIGPVGPQGEAATIRVGTVESVDPGEPVDVQNVGDNHDAIFNFCLPKGDKGDTGELYIDRTDTLTSDKDATVVNRGTSTTAHLVFGIPRGKDATVAVGSVTTLPAGSTVTVENVGTAEDAVFDFGLPTTPTVAVGSTTTLAAGSTPTVTNGGTTDAIELDFGLPTTPTVAVGSTTTLADTESATVTNSGTTDAIVLDFGIPHGRAATATVGTTTTLAPGSPATVQNSGTSGDAILDFGIPRGTTIAVGTTTTLQPGQLATVTNSGTASDLILDFGIPAGNPYAENVPIENGGTGANTAAGARTNLDVPSTTEVTTEISTAVTNLRNGFLVNVQTLPATGESGKIYLVPDNASETGNVYKEYVWNSTENTFELLGPATLDLSSYSTKAQTVSGLSVSGTTLSYTKADGTSGSLTTQDTTYSTATTSAVGLMSASDKSKLDEITASADAVSITRSLTSGTAIGTITINDSTSTLYCETNTHNTAYLYAGESSGSANASTTNGNTHLILKDGSDVSSRVKITGANATSVTSDASGNITISSSNTQVTANSTVNGTRPILLRTTSSASMPSYTSTVYYDTDVTVDAVNGVVNAKSFNGAPNCYGECSTAAATQEKAVTVQGAFILQTGVEVIVKFTIKNTASSPTLNVNSTGAKSIYYRDAAIAASYLAANSVYKFLYDGTYWQFVGDVNVDTNTYVTQTLTSTASEYAVLTKDSTGTTTVTSGARFDSKVKINHSYGRVSAVSYEGVTTAVSASTITVYNGAVFTKTISADVTFTFSGVTSGKASCFSLILTDGGAYTVTWPSSVKWASGEAPDLASSGVDVLTFLTHDGGTTWYGIQSIAEAA